MDVSEMETAALFARLACTTRGTTWGRIASEIAFTGSASKGLGGDDEALFDLPLDQDRLSMAHSQLVQWCSEGLHVVTVLDDSYPPRLLDIRETPPFLFYRGRLLADDLGMSVVGSRHASDSGLALAARIAEYLVSAHLTVVAGLAAGIDTAAHQAALACGGRTVAFLGTGITRSYPAENATLQEEIARSGLLLSQFYPTQPPTKQTFPMRNAAMSGYGSATIVVEAGEHSGSRIQARLAGQHGRPVILTSRVADGTSWGESLSHEPNVYVAATMGEVKDAVQDVLTGPDRLSSAIAALATA